ncbi:hypothetical protein R84981_002802 [Carnimonas sp. R-84981]|uniref:hypothetical protein n=1 Tax=Carnimonas bestiolae TaxID=3402172 RepID=UPI003EDBA3AE
MTQWISFTPPNKQLQSYFAASPDSFNCIATADSIIICFSIDSAMPKPEGMDLEVTHIPVKMDIGTVKITKESARSLGQFLINLVDESAKRENVGE